MPAFKKGQANRANTHLAGRVLQSDLNSLLREAVTMYQSEVVNGRKLYKLFAADFLNSHHHTDRRDAAGLNEHRKNLGILRRILFTRKDLLVRFSEAGTPDDATLKRPVALVLHDGSSSGARSGCSRALHRRAKPFLVVGLLP